MNNGEPRDEGERDPLVDLQARLAGLDEQPVEEHPDVLEAVHRTVVSELNALSGVGAPAAPRSGEPT